MAGKTHNFKDIPPQPVIDELANFLRSRGMEEKFVTKCAFQNTEPDVYQVVSVVNKVTFTGWIKCFPFQPVYAYRFKNPRLMQQIPPFVLNEGKHSVKPMYQLHLDEKLNLELVIARKDLFEEIFKYLRDITSAPEDHPFQVLMKKAKAVVQVCRWDVDMKTFRMTFGNEQHAFAVVEYINQNFPKAFMEMKAAEQET